MSRSNPTDNTPNPAVRWFEWNGEQGGIRYYDKDKKTQLLALVRPRLVTAAVP